MSRYVPVKSVLKENSISYLNEDMVAMVDVAADGSMTAHTREKIHGMNTFEIVTSGRVAPDIAGLKTAHTLTLARLKG